jgi:hypothetical protein
MLEFTWKAKSSPASKPLQNNNYGETEGLWLLLGYTLFTLGITAIVLELGGRSVG